MELIIYVFFDIICRNFYFNFVDKSYKKNNILYIFDIRYMYKYVVVVYVKLVIGIYIFVLVKNVCIGESNFWYFVNV